MLRIAESIAFAAIAIAGIVAAIVPAVVAAGLSKDEIANSSDPAGAVVEWIISHLMLFVWIFALGFIVLGVMIAVHSFVEAGSTLARRLRAPGARRVPGDPGEPVRDPRPGRAGVPDARRGSGARRSGR